MTSEREAVEKTIKTGLWHYFDEVTAGLEDILGMVKSGDYTNEEIAGFIEDLLRKVG